VIANVPRKFRGKICMVCDTQATRFLNGFAYCDYHDPETYKNVSAQRSMKIKSTKKTVKRNRAKYELDAIARQGVFDRDGWKCVRCGRGSEGRLQPSHVIGRRHLCTRWLPENLLTMCGGCHIWWHEYPSLSGPWFIKNWPERHEYIHAVYNAGGKINPIARLEELKAGGAKP
jgi:5-methylcytosine-specific restriction endonuclease McrA